MTVTYHSRVYTVSTETELLQLLWTLLQERAA